MISPQLVQSLSYAMLAVIAALIGGVVAIYYRPGPVTESNLQHLSAGIIFAAVAANLLPDVHAQAPVFVVVGFGLGVATMLAVHQLSRRIENAGVGGGFAGATSFIIAVSLNTLIDGILIGVAFLNAPKTGVIISLALAFETLFIAATAVTMLPKSLSTVRKLSVPLLFGGLMLFGVTAGTLVFGGLSGAPIAIVIAFGAANLIYLVTEELLVKAAKVPETPTSTTLFFAGFLLIFIFDMVYTLA
ncbi:ZIP family metal transporter [Halarchaeum sp. P4]|uniref:ZIP family metal transporter n=1 Tax=Halarchaeum sp. P4 TaxID=3421639 RepID=UPI003EB76A44